MRMMIYKSINSVSLFALLVCVSSVYLFGYVQFVGEFTSLLCVGSCFALIYKAYKSQNALFFTLFCFLTLYAWPSKLLFIDHLYLSGHHLEYTFTTAFWTTSILTLFFLLVGRYVRIPLKESIVDDFYRHNKKIFYGLFFISLLITILFRPVGNLYNGEEDSSNFSLYEYNLILLYVIYKYADSRYKLLLFAFLCLLYSYFTVISGGRIAIIMLGLLLLVIRFQNTLRFRTIAIAAIMGIWLMNIYENVRSNPIALLEGNIIEILTPLHQGSLEVQASNFGDVFWASERLIILSDIGELTWSDRLSSLFYFLISPFFSMDALPDTANLTFYKRDIYSSGGGSLAPVIFYIYLGVFGVYLFAKFIVRRLNNLVVINTSFRSTYSVFLVVTLPRWFAYYPLQLIKFCVIAAIFILLVEKIDRKLLWSPKYGNTHQRIKS